MTGGLAWRESSTTCDRRRHYGSGRILVLMQVHLVLTSESGVFAAQHDLCGASGLRRASALRLLDTCESKNK